MRRNHQIALILFHFLWIYILLISSGAVAQRAIYRIDRPLTGGAFIFYGYSASGRGDVNNDGVPDFIVGAASDATTAPDAGMCQVYSGQDESILHTLYGDMAGDRFGITVCILGDITGDGYAEFVCGAIQETNGGSGYVRVLSGLDGSLVYELTGNVPGDGFGYRIAPVGDIDRDGYPDLVISASQVFVPFESGYFRVISGLTGAIIYEFTATTNDSRFAWSVGGAGDVNADGIPDIIIGSIGDLSQANIGGYVRVYSGDNGSIIYDIFNSIHRAQFGSAVDGVGDINGDGYGDFIVGSRNELVGIERPGVVRVYSGIDATVLYEYVGLDEEQFGNRVAGCGDVNGDGVADFGIGTSYAARNDRYSGFVGLYSGLNGDPILELIGKPSEGMGSAIAPVGDMDSDGFDDIIIGYGWGEEALVLAGTDVALILDGVFPSESNRFNFLEVRGAEPGGIVHLAGGKIPGFTALSCVGGEVEIVIDSPKISQPQVADASGYSKFRVFIPPELSGYTLRAQAFEPATCRFSNLLVKLIP